MRAADTPSGSLLPNAGNGRDLPNASQSAGNEQFESREPSKSPEFVQQYIGGKLAFWQQRLKLSDWKLSWTFADPGDLKPNTVGQIHWDKPSKTASILVLSPSGYHMPFQAMLDDMEFTIIHELVHLELTSLPHSEASRGSEEQAVNGIAGALFALEHPTR
ncbi:MAG TPA: hypothetical protein VGR96_14995 [Acidobacteriaceae bacterium]|nr:hypothetical protein [Acidobacteriaceae bacterium]